MSELHVKRFLEDLEGWAPADKVNMPADVRAHLLALPDPEPRRGEYPESLAALIDAAHNPAEAERQWLAAMAGDADAVSSLAVGLPNKSRGALVAELDRAGAPLPVLRAALQDVWDHDHGWLMRAFARPRLIDLFRRAAFDVSHLPTRFTVWRGTRAPRRYAGHGLSWTTDRARAVWFATTYIFRPSDGYAPRGPISDKPLLLRAVVTRSECLATCDARDEAEIVVSPRRWRIEPIA